MTLHTRAAATAVALLGLLPLAACGPRHGEAAEVDLAHHDRNPAAWANQGGD